MEEKTEEVKEEKKDIQEKKSKNKIIFIIILCLLISVIGVFVYFKFIKHSNKQIVFYRYQDKLFLKNKPNSRLETYYQDVDASKLKEYTYQCKYDQCRVYSLQDQKSGFDDSIDGTWVLLYDSNEKEEWPGSSCATKKGEYVLYNVESKKRLTVPTDENICITDIYLDNDGNPKGLVAEQYGNTVSHYVIDIKTGKIAFNTNDVIFGNTEEYQRNIRVINNGKKNLYIMDAQYYSNALLYDENFNYINDIINENDFDPDGNVIKVYSDTKTNKSHFKIFDMNGKSIYTSKMYDDLDTDNGYFIAREGDKVSIIDYKEKKLVDISSNASKYTYTTYYNKYIGEKGIVSVFETKDNDEEELTGILYKYNPKENKLTKENIDFDGVSPLVALSRYFSNGYTKYKIKNTTVFLDNELNEKKQTELKKKLEDLSNDKITKKLFEAKQNIYLFTEYDYDSYDVKAYENRIYSPLCIPVNDLTSIGTIVKKIAVNYFNNNYKKLNNDSFQKIYSKYYKYMDDSVGHYYNEAYYEPGLFGYIMASYFYKENKWESADVDNNVYSMRNKIEKDNKIDDFDNVVKKYIESYILK